MLCLQFRRFPASPGPVRRGADLDVQLRYTRTGVGVGIVPQCAHDESQDVPLSPPSSLDDVTADSGTFRNSVTHRHSDYATMRLSTSPIRLC